MKFSMNNRGTFISRAFFFISLAAFAVVSCLPEGKNEFSQTLCVDFEFDNTTNAQIFKDDSVFTTNFFAYSNAICFFSDLPEEGGEFHGGMGLQLGSDSTVLTSYPKYPYRAYSTKGGAYGSSCYAFFHGYEDTSRRPDYDISAYLYSTESSANPISMMVSNTNLVINQVRNGYGIGKPFGDGDWLRLTVTGYEKGTVTGKVTVALADFATYRDSVMVGWHEIKLDALGDADAMRFDVSSNRSGVAQDFCIDNLYMRVHQIY